MSSASTLHQIKDMAQLVAHGGPAVCNISVTNVCNARCDFCNYAYDKPFVTDKRTINFEALCEAIDILYERGVRYLTLSGGEPFLHPRLKDIVAYAEKKTMRSSVITNGFLLSPRTIGELKAAGLKTMFISIDAATAKEHEDNRGLPGVCEKIKEANKELKRLEVKTVASVTISKLIRDYHDLIRFLEELGFETVTFSYPKKALGSSSLVYSDSSLVDFTPQELSARLEEIKKLKSRFGILNPAESLSEMLRFIHKEKQRFECYGGFKYFFLDSKLDVYRCDYLPTKMGTIHEFRTAPFIRDGCTECMSTCYRDSSVLLHFAVSLGDAFGNLKKGKIGSAVGDLFTDSNGRSIKALFGEWDTLRKLAKRGNGTP
jgi:MoaA/NifB/PqqE/SkfB family radical SAM enzyme